MSWLMIILVAIALGHLLIRHLALRIRMELRARTLRQLHPQAESERIYLPLISAFPATKRKAIEAKIAEMHKLGWTFVRMSEANPLRTLLSWGGGVNIHFIRVPPV